MNDYVEMDDLKEAMFNFAPVSFPTTQEAYKCLLNYVEKNFKKSHPVAEWKLIEVNGENQWACGACNHVPHHRRWSEPRDKFCENCGAQMIRRDKD